MSKMDDLQKFIEDLMNNAIPKFEGMPAPVLITEHGKERKVHVAEFVPELMATRPKHVSEQVADQISKEMLIRWTNETLVGEKAVRMALIQEAWTYVIPMDKLEEAGIDMENNPDPDETKKLAEGERKEVVAVILESRFSQRMGMGFMKRDKDNKPSVDRWEWQVTGSESKLQGRFTGMLYHGSEDQVPGGDQ